MLAYVLIKFVLPFVFQWALNSIYIYACLCSQWNRLPGDKGMLKCKQKQQEEQLTCERSRKKYFWFGDLGLEGRAMVSWWWSRRYFWFGDLGLEGFDLGRWLHLYVWERAGKNKMKKAFCFSWLWRRVFLSFIFVPLKQNTCGCHMHESSNNNKTNIWMQSVTSVIV